MVLTDLGRKINGALSSLANRPKIDEAALAAMCKDLQMALLEADVSARLVKNLTANIKSLVNLEELAKAPPANQRRIVQKAVFDELVRLVDPGSAPWAPKRAAGSGGKPNVVMFVGLQGSGKTTSCTKLAYYYTRKGYKTAMICTDTFRAGAFDQLKQNATKAKIPFYGSYTETDPVTIAIEGIERFTKEKFDIIIIDTSGCHVTEEELFGEMTSIASVVKPDNVIFVMDGTIGQSAEMQARNFKNAVNVGSIIMTKMDGHAKGGGAISAVAATGSPIIFIGTGEHIQDLERFDSRGFISKMMGFGDLGGLMEKFQDLKLENSGFMKNMEQGKFTMRDMREQIQNMMSLGPMSKIMGMMPGMPADLMSAMGGGGGDEEGSKRMRKMMAAMDSMTDQELDDDGALFTAQPSRVKRIARGSGSKPEEIDAILKMHGAFAGMVKQMGGKDGWMSQLKSLQGGGGGAPGANPTKGMNPLQLAKLRKQALARMSPEMQKKMRQMAAAGKQPTMEDMMGMMGGGGAPGMSGMAEMMQSMMGGGGMGGMAEMMQSMMGGGGAGGAPGMGGMAEMMQSMMGGGGAGGMAEMMRNLGGLGGLG
ncbi:Signal recognition particle [Blastocladiella emersonii ATCC 22665]|nr:Signal recognition particle [Blastocladiella emersonii ATCC 22665]